jgi:hypothetical protein
MKRTTLMKRMGLAHSEEEEKTKMIDKEEGMRKEEQKLHSLKTPLLGKKHCRRGRFILRNPQQERICALISPSWRPHSRRKISVWSMELWRMLLRTSYRDMERRRKSYMEGMKMN